MTQLRCAVLLTLWLVLPPRADARTWHIKADASGDAPTIQAGVNLAAPGDSLELWPGTFFETIVIGSKNLVLYGRDGAAASIIDGNGAGPVVTTAAGRVEDVTIQNGICDCQGAGIAITGGSVVVERCNVEGNQAGLEPDAGQGGGIWVSLFTTAARIEACVVRANVALDGGGGIACYGVGAQLLNNVLVDNYAKNAGGAIFGSVGLAAGNLILRNRATNSSPGVDLRGIVRNNTIVFNHLDFGAGTANRITNCEFSNNIVAFNGSAFIGAHDVYGLTAVRSQLNCCDVWGNDRDGVDGSSNTGTTFSLDPLFCDAVADDFHIARNSPCADCSGVVGAFGVSCGSTQVLQATWGDIKRMYR